jgi:hypothetical protein
MAVITKVLLPDGKKPAGKIVFAFIILMNRVLLSIQ